ncbi:hypothetical protein C5167_033016 [Papaver somniferum]|uniref:Uncharacterized protein n=1 Tax=Papaver somniferum TaxID=3469 RepID=A0A4Y7KC12_PAPSO|nr:hypothetical protein C5167_033016 [Papaver somniferum]
MAKLRGKPIPTTISRIRRKKMKIEDPTTTKDGVKPGTSKGSKTELASLRKLIFCPLGICKGNKVGRSTEDPPMSYWKLHLVHSMDWSNPIEFYRLTAPDSGKVKYYTANHVIFNNFCSSSVAQVDSSWISRHISVGVSFFKVPII